MRDDKAMMRIQGGGIRPVVVKHARHPSDAAVRLRHEAAVLRAAQQPGVVTLLEVVDDDDTVTLTTRYCGARTLATIGTTTVAHAAGLVAALATTIGDLHERGIHHGRVTSDHVLVAADGRPVLCGFGSAALPGQDQPASSDDVAALGELLRGLIGSIAEVDGIPALRRSRRSNLVTYQRRALLNLADQATADDPAVRPSARQLSQSIRATVPDATLFAPSEPGVQAPDPTAPHIDEPRHDRRLAIGGMAAAAVVVGATILAIVTGGHDPHTETSALPPVEPPAPIEPTTTTTTSTSPPLVASGSAPPGSRNALGCSARGELASAPATFSDGRPCPVDLQVGAGWFAVGDTRFEVGLANGAAAVGDFSCGGTPQVALVDLGSGDVFLFEEWATAERPTTATVIATVDSARRLLAEPVGDRACHQLVALDEFGIRHALTPGPTS